MIVIILGVIVIVIATFFFEKRSALVSLRRRIQNHRFCADHIRRVSFAHKDHF